MFHRNPRPPSFLHNPTAIQDASAEEESQLEDSLAGPSQHRSFPQPSLFQRPPQRSTVEGDGFAFATTPNSVAPPLPPFALPNRNASGSTVTPQGMLLPPAQPPRIERQQYRPQPQAATGAIPQQTLFGSPSADVSGSFSFGPRGHAGGGMQLRPPFAGHLPMRPVGVGGGGGRGVFNPPSQTIQQHGMGANLDSAAIATERRIREQRAATRTTSPQQAESRRVVSFSTQHTPQNPAAGYAYQPQLPPAARPNRIAQPTAITRGGADASTSHLGAPYADLSLSTSTNTSIFPQGRQTAVPTRLFAFPSHTTPANAESTSISISADPSTTTTTSSHSNSLTKPDAPETVRLRKWDGTQTTVPSYIVADQAETVVEDWFEFDVVHRFKPSQIFGLREEKVTGTSFPSSHLPKEGKEGEREEDVDVLQAILETQLGLRGFHGWYGYTYSNPPSKPLQRAERKGKGEGDGDGRSSRKRRRSSSPSSSPASPASPNHIGEEPIVVYDTFGRIRGKITLPSYSTRGGPRFPLPSPRETFALRHNAASALVLKAGSVLSEKEGRLLEQMELAKERYDELQSTRHKQGEENKAKEKGKETIKSDSFYNELKAKHKALTRFQRSHKVAMLKGLQNAMLDSASFGGRPGLHST